MTPSPSYVELHCHSGFSFLDGASHPEELVFRALELGYPALALTDHNGLYGSMEFAQAAVAQGLQPITGAELTIALDVPGVPQGLDGLSDDPSGEDRLERGAHVTLLAENPTGYANLCRLISESHLESERGYPTLPLSSLLERAEGLICLSGCRRSPILMGLEDSVATAELITRRLVSAFGPRNLFIELQNNRAKGDGYRTRMLGRLADRMGLGVVATGNVHYHDPGRHKLQDVLVSIRGRATLDGSHVLRRPNACWHMASPREMAWRFSGRADALTNTCRIAERCGDFDLTTDLGYDFPDFEGSERGGALETLAAVCLAKLRERYAGSKHEDQARERLHQELALVDLHGLGGFFLVYRDIMNLAREVAFEIRGESPRAHAGLPPGRGRGSSVSSIICYLIGLSHVDPVETNLFLGRFLNEAMQSVPDIDLDFPRDIREALILRVYEEYGAEHAGLVCTFPTYRMRSTVREIGKSLDLPLGTSKSSPSWPNAAAGVASWKRWPGWTTSGKRRPLRSGRPWPHSPRRSGGFPRHVSQHVGGMIISSRPLVEMVPLEPAAMEGRVLCQWTRTPVTTRGSSRSTSSRWGCSRSSRTRST